MKHKIKSVLGLTAAFGLAALTTQAAVVSLTPYTDTADWPSSPDVESLNAFEVPNAQSSVRNTLSIQQSFTVTNAFTVGSIYLTIQDYDPAVDYTVRFYSMGGSGANSTSLEDWQITNTNFTGTQVGSTISSFTGEPGTMVSGNNVLKISLDPAEQVTLAAGDYFISFTDISDTTYAFYWKLANDSPTDYYADGRFYDSGGIKSQAAYRDYGLALEAIPEPATIGLIGLMGGGILFIRRRMMM